MSRIEQGKRNPNKKKLYKLLKKMGMDRENYYGFIHADSYELYEKVRQYNRCFPKGQQNEARILLDQIESKINMAIPVNQQFIGMERIYEQMALKKLSPEKANQKLRELLGLTMPLLVFGKLIYRVPFRTEYMICNHIAVNLREDGKVEEALHIYEQLLYYYKKSKVSMRYHAVPGLTLYINYVGYLEAHDDLEKAIYIGKEGLQHSLDCCRGDISGDILANLSLVYEKQGLPDVEEMYLRNGYYLNKLYNRGKIIKALQNAYIEKFRIKID